MTYKDKFKHIGCGVIAAVVGALVLGLMFSGCTTYWQAYACGVLCAGAAGMAAEVKDMAYHSMHIAFFDIIDLLATVAGGALGAAAGALIVLLCK